MNKKTYENENNFQDIPLIHNKTEFKRFMEPFVSVIIPALNEEKTIGTCIHKVKQVCEQNEIPFEIILADSSQDRTAEIASSLGARVIHPEKKGYGNAYIAAFSYIKGDIVIFGDADNTYDFSEIPSLIHPIQNGQSDMVIGSRMKGTILPGSMPPLHRYIGNPVLTLLVNFTFHTHFSDAHSGFRAISKDALGRLSLHTGGMEFASEMLIEAAKKGLRISEIPIVYYPRQTPSNLHSFADGWRHIRFIMMVRPLRFMMVPGTFFILLGLIFMAGISFIKPVELQGLHSFILGDIFLLGGLQFLCSGFVMKSFSVTHHLDDCGPWFAKILHYHSLEKFLTLGGVLMVLGFCSGVFIFYEWLITKGPLSQITNAIISLSAVIIGLQLIFTALHISMMLLRCERDGCGFLE